MSNGGSLIDSIRNLFSTSGPERRAGGEERDPVEARMERVEQVASGVEMAAAALPGDRKQLRREAEGAAEAVLEAARARRSEGGEGSPGAGGGEGDEGPSPGRRQRVQELGRLVEALEELHYRVLRCEVHPEIRAEDELEAAADRAREAADRAREVADEVRQTAAA